MLKGTFAAHHVLSIRGVVSEELSYTIHCVGTSPGVLVDRTSHCSKPQVQDFEFRVEDMMRRSLQHNLRGAVAVARAHYGCADAGSEPPRSGRIDGGAFTPEQRPGHRLGNQHVARHREPHR